MDKKYRIVVMDILQAFAMILVILGHHLLGFMPEVYGKIHYYIYTFHMPLFIFISGFLISYSYKEDIGYFDYVKKRFIKFFIPYLIIGTIVTILYYFLYNQSILDNLKNLVISPKESSTTFLWYIYLLFFLYMLYPLIYRILNNKIIWGIILAAFVFNIFPIKTPVLCLDYFSKYFIFYLLGCISAKYYTIFQSKTIRSLSLISLIFFVAVSFGIFIADSDTFKKIELFIIPYLAIPSAYFIALALEKINFLKKISVVISKECFHIYLFHMFVVQGLALIFHKFYPEQLSVMGMIVYILISTSIAIITSIYFFRILNSLLAIVKR